MNLARVRERRSAGRLSVRTMTVDIGVFLRERGGVAIVPESFKDRDLRSERLFVEDFVCVLRKGHPLGRTRLTAKRLAALEHVLVAPIGASQRSMVDVLLANQGLSRRITRVVMSFSAVLPLVAHSDRVALLPRSFAELHARAFGLEMRAAPLRIPPAELSLGWHLKSELDPKHVFTRQLVRDAVRDLGLSR